MDNGPWMDALLEAAFTARKHAHAPYSGFLVGAALESADGRTFAGYNIESSSYGLTCCAERTAAFAADTTWHWSLFLKGMKKDSPYNRYWGQMVRWLASQDDMQKKTGPSVTSMIPRDSYEAGEAVTLRAAVTDKEGQSTAYANVWADVKGPDGKTTHLSLAAVTDQIGLYEAAIHPQIAGEFKVTFGASKDGGELGKDSSGFTILQAAGEMDVLAAQPTTLREIARTTGGSYVELASVSSLAERIAAATPAAAMPVKTIYPLYHSRGFFLLVVAFLGVEIFLRRKWQLQ